MWKWLLAALALAVIGLVLLPLRQVAHYVAPELTATEVSGSVWRGRLKDAHWRGVELGDLKIGVDPRALLGGQLRLDFDRGAAGLTGRLGTGGGIHLAERLNGAVRVPLASPYATNLDVALTDAAISVDSAGVCRAASGEIATRLSGIPGIGTSPILQGVARCDDGALLLPLVSADGSIGLDVHLWADRRYRADIKIASTSMVVRLALTAAGFTTDPNGSSRRFEGRL
nr:type II secretion system protein N [Polymorphobacter sp.]